MKKWLILLIGILVLVGCSAEAESKLVHEDLQKDIKQMISITDEAYNNERKLTDEEKGLFKKFKNKYLIGWFFDSNDEVYELNDLEKQIVRNVYDLELFVLPTNTLSSETHIYERKKEEIKELMNKEDIPENLTGKYPTYEKFPGNMPKEFKLDSLKLLAVLREAFENQNYSKKQQDEYSHYMNKYQGVGYKLDGINYFHNDTTEKVVSILFSINFSLKDNKNDNSDVIVSYINDVYELLGVK